jgi:chromosome segregation ATPase
MSRLFVSAAVVLAMCLSGCMITDVEDPEQLRDRAETLRARAAGLRKSAREYDVLLERSQQRLSSYETRLAAHRKRRARIEERIDELRTEKSKLSPQEAEDLQPTIRNYLDERAATQAKIDEQLTNIQRLKAQMQQQRWLKKSYLKKARDREAEARRLDEYAHRREQER